MLYDEKIGMDFSVLRSSVVSKNFIGLEEIKSPFWKSALKLWLDFNKEEICNVTDVRDIANQLLYTMCISSSKIDLYSSRTGLMLDMCAWVILLLKIL